MPNTAILGYLAAYVPNVPPKMAAAAYLVRAAVINSGRTDTTAEPTHTALVVAIRFVTMEPQIAMVDATSA